MNEVAISIKNGKLGFIHNEDLDFLIKIGRANISRLSNVEFNNELHLWEVIYKTKVLSAHKSRKEAIAWEISYFNALIMKGDM